MVLYDNIDNAIKENKQKLNNNHIRNLKIMNILNALVMGFLIAIDIFLLIKGIFTGMPSSVTALLIIFVVAQTGSLVVFSIKRFARASMVTKVGIVIICTLPIIPYIIYLSIGNNIYIACLIARIIGVAALAMLLFNTKTTNDKKTFGVKGIPLAIASLFALLVVLYILVSTTNRKVIYSYDPLYEGYVVSDVLSGKGEVNIDNNTVAISSKSLKNVSGNLVIPKNVRYIAEDAFLDSDITSLTVYSENIELMKAVSNSNIENIYLESTNATIDIDNIDKDIEIATNREVVDQYRETYRKYDYLFVPKLNSGEYYVCFNGTNLPVYIYKEAKEINEPQKDSLPKEIDGKKILFNGYYVSNKEINFPINVSSNTKIACEYSYIYNVTYDFSGCEDIYDLPTTYYNKIGDVELPELSKDGYKFKGWYDVDQYGNYTKEYKKLDRTLKNDINLKAKFLKEFTVTYDKVLSNATLDGNTKEIYTEEDVVELKNPTIDGFTFDGWYLDSKYNVKATTYLNSDTTLYAKWKINNIVTLSDDVNKVFDNTESNVNVSAVAELKDVTISYSFYDKDDNLIVNDNNFNVINAKDSNDYYAKITFNYKDIVIYEMKTDYINVTINKATYDMTDVVVSDEEYVYDGTFHTPSITGVLPTGIDNIQITYSFDEGIKNVGTKNVVCHFNSLSENYEIPSDIEGMVTITEREVTINWNSKLEFEYDRSMKFPEYTLKNVISSDIENLKCNSTGSANGIGEHTAKITSLVQDSGNVYKNYKLTSNQSNLSIQYTIVPRTNEIDGISVSNVETVYDGNIHLPEVVMPSGIKAIYSQTPKKAGNYEIDITFEYENDKNTVISNKIKAKVTILPRTLDIEWSYDEITYDGNINVPMYSIKNVIGDDQVSLEYLNVDSINAGTYNIEYLAINGDSKNNYKLPEGGYTYKITPEEIEINTSTLGFVDTEYDYNTQYQYPTVDESKLPQGVNVSYSGYGKDAKKYNVTASFSINSTNKVIKEEDKSITVEVKINPIEAKIKWGSASFSYDGKPHTPSATVSNLFAGDSCNVVVTTNDEAIGVNTYTATVSSLSNKNYTLPEEAITTNFEIVASEFDFKFSYDSITLPYDGNIHSPEVKIEGERPTWLSIEYDSNGIINAGTETITATFISSNPSYKVPNPVSATVTITAIEAIISFELNENVYNGKAIYPTAKVSNAIGEDNPTVILDDSYLNKINAGVHTVEAIGILDNPNYKITDSKSYSYTILKAKYDVSNIQFVDASFEYDGNPHRPTISAIDEEKGIKITGIDGDVIISYTEGITNVGTKLITATFTGSPNYEEIQPMTARVTVTPKEVELIWGDNTFTYTGSIIKPECNISGYIGNETSEFTLTAQGINVGEYTATISNLTNNNYKLPTNTTYKYYITKAKYEISNLSFESDTKVYDKTVLYPKIVGTKPDNLEIEYEGLSSNVGTHTITIRLDAGSNYETIASIEVDVTITKKSISVVFDSLEAKYTGTISYPTPRLIGVISGDICNLTTNGGGTNVGEYTIEIVGIDNNNYSLSETSNVTYKIIPADYDMTGIEFNDVEFEYNGKEQKPSITGTLPQGVSIEYSTGATNVNDGEVEVTATFKTIDDNYNTPKSMRANVKILPKEINASWTNTVFDYDNNKHSATATLIGIIDGDNCEATISGYGINAGNHTCEIVSLNNSNYSISASTASIEIIINKINYDMSSIKFEDKTFQYNGLLQQQVVSGNLESIIGLDNIRPEIDEYIGYVQNVSDGEVTCVVTFKTESINYNVPENMECKISVVPLTLDLNITLDTDTSKKASVENNNYKLSYTYDGDSHSVNITFDESSLISGDIVSFNINGEFKDVVDGGYSFDILSNNENYISAYNKLNVQVNVLYCGVWWEGLKPHWWGADCNDYDDIIFVYTDSTLGIEYIYNDVNSKPIAYGSYTLTCKSISSNLSFTESKCSNTYDVDLTEDSLLELAYYYSSNNEGVIADYKQLLTIESLYGDLGISNDEIDSIIDNSVNYQMEQGELIEFISSSGTKAKSTSDYCSVSGNLNNDVSSKIYNGHEFTTALKMSTSTAQITLNLENTDYKYIVIITDSANKYLNVNDQSYQISSDGLIKLKFTGDPSKVEINRVNTTVNVYGIILYK